MAAQPLRCLRVLRVSIAPFALAKFCGRCAAGSHEAVVLNLDPGKCRDLYGQDAHGPFHHELNLAASLPRGEIWRVALCSTRPTGWYEG